MKNPLRDIQPLIPYLRKYRLRYLGGFLMLLGEVVFWVAVPQVIRFAVDSLYADLRPGVLLRYSLLLLAVALSKGFFLFWSRMILVGISRDVEYDLRNDLYRHFNRLSLSYFQKNRTGDLMSRSTNDMNSVRMLLGPGIMYSLRTIVILVAALSIMASISVRLTMYSFLMVPVIVTVVSVFGQKIHIRFEKIQAMLSELSAKVQESIAGIRVLKAYTQEQSDIRQFRELNEEFVGKNRKLIRLWGLFYPSLDVLMGITYAIVLWMGGREVAAGRITIGSFIAFNVYMGQLSWPMIALGWVVNLYQRGTASLGRLNEILTTPPEIADDPALMSLHGDASTRTNGYGAFVDQADGVEIEFRDLSFAYDGHAVLHNINLNVPAGSTLAIVGPTGSGKSTLVNLLPRLFDSAPGSILLNGRSIREYPLETLRRMIGFVPQETFLFSETIRENIAFGVSDASDDAVRRSAEIAGLLADVEGFPAHFATLVGERGITLSGGQKQRAAIARAVIRNPKLLILDDALSSVDTQTEETILNRLTEVMRGRTTILISHRISTIRGADQIVVIDNGTIAERGTHDELMANGTYYPDLYQKQLLEEELERA